MGVTEENPLISMGFGRNFTMVEINTIVRTFQKMGDPSYFLPYLLLLFRSSSPLLLLLPLFLLFLSFLSFLLS